MPYMHGIRVKENPTSMPTPDVSSTGVPVIFGTAPVNLAADPDNATNRLFLCHNFSEAKMVLGYSDDYRSYTLCQSMDAFFKAFSIGPVVFCNVLDPKVHKDDFTETLEVTDGHAVSKTEGVLLSGLKITDGTGNEPMTIDKDYLLEMNEEGYASIIVLKEAVSSIKLTGSVLDASKVTEANLVGSYDALTGKETGTELVRQVYPSFGLAPGMLLAPGFSHIPAVGLALQEKTAEINGRYKCECILDIDTTKATKNTDVEKVKLESGYLSEHSLVLWPMTKYAGKIMSYSAIYAAMTCRLDYDNENVPSLYPSNKPLRISATVLDDGTEILLDQMQANELNAVGVVTALNLNGFKSWGNNTAAYPDTVDPKDRWIACRRFFSWWGNRFINTYMEKVDDCTNYRLVESVVDSENVRGNSLVSQDKCAGIRMTYPIEDNPIGNILGGKVVFRQYLAPYAPAEDIMNILEFDPRMIEAALGGEA